MIVNTINKSGNSSNNNGFIYEFQEQSWEHFGSLYVLNIPASTHNLGLFCFVVSVEKQDNASYIPTMFTYDRYANGTISIQASQPFDGRAILEKGAN